MLSVGEGEPFLTSGHIRLDEPRRQSIHSNPTGSYLLGQGLGEPYLPHLVSRWLLSTMPTRLALTNNTGLGGRIARQPTLSRGDSHHTRDLDDAACRGC